jgi:hypothetical protein
MDNAGGIIRLWWGDSQYYSGLTNEDLPGLIFTGNNLHEISFADEGGSLSISETETDHGTSYSVSIVLKVPKITGSNLASLAVVKDALRSKKVILVALDNNGQYCLIGGSGAYFNVTSTGDHGTVMADLNHIKLHISADLDTGQVFIANPLLASWDTPELDVLMIGAGIELVATNLPVLQQGDTLIRVGLQMIGSDELTEWHLYEDRVLVESSPEADPIAVAYPFPMVYYTFTSVTVKRGLTYQVMVTQH